MNIVLVGYGRMGLEVEKIASERGHTIISRVDPIAKKADADALSKDILRDADMAIEFSLAEAVEKNAKFYSENRVRAVVGTTGVSLKRDTLDSLFCAQGAYLAGSNFSVGAHIFSALVERAAELCRGLDAYDVFMYEIHHRLKQDSPSGTALGIAERIVQTGKKRTIVTERLDRGPEKDELHVASLRGGSIPGIHTVMLDSEADTIELRHSARNRSGFALGAVLAAEWLAAKQGVFTVEDFIQDLLVRGGVS
jgi:4-hydroxy-tetrahydrodipicolinate reductase